MKRFALLGICIAVLAVFALTVESAEARPFARQWVNTGFYGHYPYHSYWRPSYHHSYYRPYIATPVIQPYVVPRTYYRSYSTPARCCGYTYPYRPRVYRHHYRF